MTTPAKIAIAAVIVAALAAVVGYDLLYGKPKPGETSGGTTPQNESGLTILPASGSSAAELIGDAEQREAGAGVRNVQAPAGGSELRETPAVPPPLPADPVPSNEEYVVQAGETLADIAERKYGDQSKWTIIAKANKSVNPNKMRIGTKLVLPSEAASVPVDPPPAETVSTPPESAPRSYTIQAGDVLSKIAKRFYGTSSAALRIQQANPEVLKDLDFLTVGATIVLPEAPARPPVTVTTGEPGTVHTTARVDPAVSTGRTHPVSHGDSLWKIAEKHHGGQGVLAYMDRLVAANPDKLASKNTTLRAGWVLALPDVE